MKTIDFFVAVTEHIRARDLAIGREDSGEEQPNRLQL
jgi:hypothetical protein